ncbi:membrane protein [Devosia pacifica]|uniref:Membrane protein n=1 Tax=Devosia pacifica TaxID=1335967 RepID=A0A918RSU5_9HYPH|nr:NAD-dependent epimerase/dehydratase family protein [Devosia pacifica]GHA11518.1 membrane protein [Devosia pacifica]
MNTGKALILGATGGVGNAVAQALLQHGWQVAALTRRDAGETRTLDDRIEWRSGDAMSASDVTAAAQDAEIIVHAVNPAGYRNWGSLVVPMIENTIAAARKTGARIVLPGTIYNYGFDAFPNLSEDSPQNPVTEKGRIRVALESRLEAASREGVPVLILRCGDFFGPARGSNWFAQALVTPGRRLKAVTYPGPEGIGHSWAYLPDIGETVAQLLDRRDQLETFARFHFGGHWDPDGRALPRAIAGALGRPDLRTKHFPWSLVGAAGLFMETPREIYKMRYLWRHSIRLSNEKLAMFLGKEPHTPLNVAVATTLKALEVR